VTSHETNLLETALASIKDRRSGQEFLRPQATGGLLAGKIDGRDMTSQGRWSLEAPRADGTWATARQSGLIGTIPYTLEMKLYRESPRIDCWMRFRFSGEKIGRVTRDVRDAASGFVHEDKLRFKLFPALGEGAVGVRDLPFAISETKDPYINGLYWTAVAEGDKGIAVFNRGTMGAVREKDGGFSIPLAYAAYYIWGTRMLSGDFEYEFALYPFTGQWVDADLHRHALEYNFPPIGMAARPAHGNLTGSFQPVRVESSGAVVSALYSRNGKTYVRVHDYRGTAGKVTLGGHGTEVDLAGHDLGAATNMLSIKPWQIRTVRLEQPIE
jgi:hypothetical protein